MSTLLIDSDVSSTATSPMVIPAVPSPVSGHGSFPALSNRGYHPADKRNVSRPDIGPENLVALCPDEYGINHV